MTEFSSYFIHNYHFYTHGVPCGAVPGNVIMLGGGGSGLGPAHTSGTIEAPAGEKAADGGSMIAVYTAEQQARLGVDESGAPLTTRTVQVHIYQARGGAPPHRGYHHASVVDVVIPIDASAAEAAILAATGASSVVSLSSPKAEERYADSDGSPLTLSNGNAIAALIPMRGMD